MRCVRPSTTTRGERQKEEGPSAVVGGRRQVGDSGVVRRGGRGERQIHIIVVDA